MSVCTVVTGYIVGKDTPAAKRNGDNVYRVRYLHGVGNKEAREWCVENSDDKVEYKVDYTRRW